MGTYKKNIYKRSQGSSKEKHYHTLHEIHKTKQEKLDKKRKQNKLLVRQNEMKECTFKPKTSKTSQQLYYGQEEDTVFESLYTSSLSTLRKGIGDCQTSEELEIEQYCTFQPNLKKQKTKYVQVNPLKITGFEEHVKQRRKIIKNNNLRRQRLDKKIQSYAKQYDARMKRLKRKKKRKGYSDIYQDTS